MTIPFLDLGAAYRELKTDIDTAIQRVLDSGWYILGPEVTAFEKAWAEYCGAQHAVGLGNGLDALVIALRALGVGPGDEVIVPSNTYIATWLAVTAVGARIVPVEPDLATHNIDTQKVAAAITGKTKVLLPVHLYGQPADLDPLLSLAKAHGLYVVEDGAQAHGARYKGQRIGAHGDIVCWSFYPGKNLGALGDGGAITTNNADLAEKVRIIANYGSKQKYVNEIAGTNSRLDPLQAAVLNVKLGALDEWTERRSAIAAHYLTELANTDLILPYVPEWASPVWHLFVVRSKDRPGLIEKLSQAGIGSLIHYPIPPHMQNAYQSMRYEPSDLPVAQEISTEVISLPIGPHLYDAGKVVAAIKDG